MEPLINAACIGCKAGIPFTDETRSTHQDAEGWCEQPTPCARFEIEKMRAELERLRLALETARCWLLNGADNNAPIVEHIDAALANEAL